MSETARGPSASRSIVAKATAKGLRKSKTPGFKVYTSLQEDLSERGLTGKFPIRCSREKRQDRPVERLKIAGPPGYKGEPHTTTQQQGPKR